MQDYKDAARAILNQLLDDVTTKDSVDARYCGRRDDAAQEEGFSDGVVPLQVLISYPHLSPTDGRLYLHTSGRH